jgi:hypothetical protein
VVGVAKVLVVRSQAVPVELLDIDQQPHELGMAARMRIVELDSGLPA